MVAHEVRPRARAIEIAADSMRLAAGLNGVVYLFGFLVLQVVVYALISRLLGEMRLQHWVLLISNLAVAAAANMLFVAGSKVAGLADPEGLIAFVGLAAPHLVRARVKGVHSKTLSMSCLMGAVLLGAADLLARGMLAPVELPVGVLTAILGGGYMLFLMHGMTRPGTSAKGGQA